MNTIDETIFFGGCGLIGCCCFFRTITDRLIHSKFTKLLADTTFIVICNAVKMVSIYGYHLFSSSQLI